MTIIMGFQDQENNIWISADSRISYGSVKIDTTTVANSKLVYMNHCIIGCAGLAVIKTYLELFIEKKKLQDYLFDNKIAVVKFFTQFIKFLKVHAFLSDPEPNRLQIVEEVEWLIATKTKLYSVDMDGTVMEFSSFGAIGSGQQIALGLLDYFSTSKEKPDVILQKIYQIILNHILDCGGTQITHNVSKFLNESNKLL